ncbi:MAG: hypothetical protein V7L21_11420 [Nostoc sp.]|uniref:hypothetical protein n=1 Tax=Nostoc sp. TaxID=1180 RepID=UPI002FFA6CD0
MRANFATIHTVQNEQQNPDCRDAIYRVLKDQSHCQPKQSHCQPMQEFAVATFFYSDGSSKSVSHRYSRMRSHFHLQRGRSPHGVPLLRRCLI